jgi:selenide,water dikinase
MTALNRIPAEISARFPIHAMTDVTGFGLLGHLLEMAKASRVGARVNMDRVPVFDGVEDCIRTGMIPGGSRQNLEFISAHTRWDRDLSGDQQIILADAQTSGGLLISLPGREAETFLEEIREAGFSHAMLIGEIIEAAEPYLIVK